MGTNIDKYKQILEKLDQLANNDENFKKELLKKYGGTNCGALNGEINIKIDDIYELCVEKIIKEQAEQFYKDFAIKEIIPQLVDDYIRMEHFKRHNNFGDFCLAVFQQIECITNHLCGLHNLNCWVIKLLDKPAWLKTLEFNEKEKKYYNVCKRTGKSIIEFLFGSELYHPKREISINEYHIRQKLNIVAYFVCYGARLEKESKTMFDNLKSQLYDLYQCRNLNHRGAEKSDAQKNAVSNVILKQYTYYLKFSALLTNFVELTNDNYHCINEWESRFKEESENDIHIDNL